MSKKIFAANWKLYKNPAQTRDFFRSFFSALSDLKPADRDIYFFPPATSLEAASEMLKGKSILFGSQNCYSQVQGAFTGEISAQTVKDLGGQLVLLGHSERRKIFKETDAAIAEKLALVQSLNLTPVFCIGETLEERESGQIEAVLKKQLSEGLSKASKTGNLVVAYEPVWAIGTGKVATPQQVQETHALVSRLLKDLGFSSPILYGGSVKPENSKELLSLPNVSGFLVGGASLEVSSFIGIINSV